MCVFHGKVRSTPHSLMGCVRDPLSVVDIPKGEITGSYCDIHLSRYAKYRLDILILIYLFLFFGFGLHPKRCTGLTLGTVLRTHSCWCSGNYVGCRDLSQASCIQDKCLTHYTVPPAFRLNTFKGLFYCGRLVAPPENSRKGWKG